MFVNDEGVLHNWDSMRWRDLVLINDCSSSGGLSTSDVFLCRVKNGVKSAFWFSRWIEDHALSEAFLELYVRAVNFSMSV